jgi:hypothetical protein
MPHHLLIPTTGDLELLHTDNSAQAILALYEGGTPVTLDFTVDGEPGGTVTFAVSNPHTETNPRAREALVWLTGVHLVIDGTAILTGVSPDLVAELVKDIGFTP